MPLERNLKMKNNFFIDLIEDIEKQLSDWKFYEVVKGRGVVYTVYLIYLKYLSDISGKCLFEDLINEYRRTGKFYDALIESIIIKRMEERNNLDSKIFKHLGTLQLKSMPKDFEKIILEISNIDFTKERTVEAVVDALIYSCRIMYTNSEKEYMTQDDMQLVNCVTELLNVEDDISIYDCTCGVGTFIAAMASPKVIIYGQERDADRAVIAYMICDMLEAGEINIEIGDVLQEPMTKNFKIDKVDRTICCLAEANRLIDSQKMQNFNNGEELLFGNSNINSGSWIYARHMLQKLDEKGIGILIAPCSALSREGSTREDRERIMARNSIKAVIQLPANVSRRLVNFCIVILEKGGDNQRPREIQMIDLTTEEGERYFEDSRMLNQAVIKKQEIDKVSKIVRYSEIVKHDYNLTPSIYLRDISRLILETTATTESMISQCEALARQNRESEIEFYDKIQRYYDTYR